MSIIEKNGVTRLRGYIHGSHLVMGATVGWVLGVRPMTVSPGLHNRYYQTLGL